MGGRIAEQVRRALILAAKTGTVVVAIDASGCSESGTCETRALCPYIAPDSGFGGATGGQKSTGGTNVRGEGGARPSDASVDASPMPVNDASKDGG